VLAGIVVPQEVYGHGQVWLADARLIDDTGAEVPYAWFTREGSANTISLPAILRENSFTPGEYTQLVVDVGEKAPFHNPASVVTPATDFIEWASVEASDDAHTWRVVQARTPIFRFQKESREGTQMVHYSGNNARYLRIRILDGERFFPVSGVTVFYRTSVPAETAPITAEMVPDPSVGARETAWRIDLGAQATNVCTVTFAVGPVEFSRNVEISISDDAKQWDSFASGQIYRYHREDAVEEHLSVEVPTFAGKRYWRIAILDGDDAPLPDVRPTLSVRPQHIVFEQQPGRNYQLLYGQSRIQAPRYDLSLRVNAKQEEAAVAGQVGAEEENSDYSDPRPWTEKNGYFLWAVVGIAVVVLGYAAIGSLRRSAPNSNS
jgi:hypothetical protein